MSQEKRKRSGHPVKIMLDTDMGPDCDDAGALAVLHALADRGEAELLSVTHCTSNPWGAGCIDAINAYYGRPDVPVGTLKVEGFLDDEKYRIYNRYITEHYPNRFANGSTAADAVHVLRRTLAENEAGSVTFVSIGPLVNLEMLLQSEADSFSPLSGTELVKRKVRELVCMAGQFPSGTEWNVQMHVQSAQAVVRDWPTPIMFSGFEIGDPILTGARLFKDTPETHPVRQAYSLYLGSAGSRSSWDLTAVLYAVGGLSQLWKAKTGGSVIITEAAESRWEAAPDRGHSYLEFGTDPAVIQDALEELLVQPPMNNL